MNQKYLLGIAIAVVLIVGGVVTITKSSPEPTGITDGINMELIGDEVGVLCKDAGETCYEFRSEAYMLNDDLFSVAIQVADNIEKMGLVYETDAFNELAKNPERAMAMAEAEEGVDRDGAASGVLAMLGTGLFGIYDFPTDENGDLHHFNLIRYDDSRSDSDIRFSVTAGNPIPADSNLAESIFQVISSDKSTYILVVSTSSPETGYLPGVTRSSLSASANR